MIKKEKIFENLTFNFSKLSNKIRITSSLNNISKQLNNISVNDVNVLNLKSGRRKKIYSTNRINTTTNKSHGRIYSSKSYRGKTALYIIKPLTNNISFEFDINFRIVKSDSFSIIHKNENKSVLKKKNLILKENLKFLLNEVKKYKKNEENNSLVKEYEKQIEYYINELEKYHREIIKLKEKYISIIKENEELKKFINSGLNNLNNSQLINSVCKTNTNKTSLNKSNKSKNFKNFRYLNLNLKNYIGRGKNVNKLDKLSLGKKSTINKTKVKKKNDDYLLIEDENSCKNKSNNITKNNIFNNSEFSKSKIVKKTNNKDMIQKFKNDYINHIIFRRMENKNKLLNNINKTLTYNRLNKNSTKDNSYEFNQPINSSRSFFYQEEKNNKIINRKKNLGSKNRNNIYINNLTYNGN